MLAKQLIKVVTMALCFTTPGLLSAQQFSPATKIFEHEIYVSGSFGQEVLKINGEDALSNGVIRIWEIGIAGSTPYILGDTGLGGNMCASVPFVVSFNSSSPAVDVFPEDCMSPPHKVGEDRITFTTPGTAPVPPRVWSWTAADGFQETGSEVVEDEITPPVSVPDNYAHPSPSDFPEADDGPGLWRTTVDMNPLDDTTTVVMSLDATSGNSTLGEPITFIARCRSNITEAFIVWNDYLADDSYLGRESWKRVTIRIGDSPAVEEEWGTSTDQQATFAPDWAGNFLKRMLDEERLVVRTTPFNENPVTAVFDIRGMETGLRQLSETCNWTF